MGREWHRPPQAVLLAIAGVVLLACAMTVPLLATGLLGTVAALVLTVFGASSLIAAAMVAALPQVLNFVIASTGRAKGIAMIDTLPPGEVLQRLLARVHGAYEANEHLAHSLLGGAGQELDGSDLSLAGPTTVHFALREESRGTYRLTQTVRYTFPRPVLDLTMSLFTTSDARLRDIIVAACDRPLFDWTYIGDADQWRVADQEPEVGLAVRFLDDDGNEHVSPMHQVTPSWVPMQDWHRHLSIFRGPVRSRPTQDPHAYVNSLQVHSIDLVDLAPAGVTPTAICELTLEQSGTHPDYGNSFWQAPFPCLLEKVTVDATGISSPDGMVREFNVTPFLAATRLVEQPENWTRAEEIAVLDVDTWALPGHGFVVLWRPETSADRRSRS